MGWDERRRPYSTEGIKERKLRTRTVGPGGVVGVTAMDRANSCFTRNILVWSPYLSRLHCFPASIQFKASPDRKKTTASSLIFTRRIHRWGGKENLYPRLLYTISYACFITLTFCQIGVKAWDTVVAAVDSKFTRLSVLFFR